MTTANVRIAFNAEPGPPIVFERALEFANLRDPGGKEFVAQHLFSELKKDDDVGTYFLALPSVVKFIRPVKQTFRLDEIGSGSHDDRINTREMWWEIGKTLLRIEHLLAQARSYHDQEQSHIASKDSEADNLSANFHLDKMVVFDLAAIFLGKVIDLAARLVFERLGASLVRPDRTNPDWERGITWRSIRNGLLDRSGNPDVASLTDDEYSILLGIFDDFLKTDHGTRLWGYRLRLAHRITPSVDRPELYTHLQSRERTPILDTEGGLNGWTRSFGGLPTVAEYSFTDLYEDAVQTLHHYIGMLERLEALPRFSPEAVASSPVGHQFNQS
jgi:hypothetical protein